MLRAAFSRASRAAPTAGLISRAAPTPALWTTQTAGLLSSAAPTPALCAVQLMPKEARRSELNAWLREGRQLLENTLRARRPKTEVPSSVLVGTNIQSCYHWIHIPAPAEEQPDTVAIVFTRVDDLHLWRSSEERCAWLNRGSHLGIDDESVLVDAEKITLQRDDGSLGGWLPSRDGSGTAEQSVPPPPAWKVAATVLLPMFVMQETNRALLLPLLATSSDTWTSLPPTIQMFFTCGWTTGTVTILLLPLARSLVERIGFIGGAKGCPDAVSLARSGSVVLMLYATAVAVGLAASEVQRKGRADHGANDR